MNKTVTTRYDVADHLRTPEEMAAYLEACLEEANGDAAFVAKALGNIARAKGMSQVALVVGLSRESPDVTATVLQFKITLLGISPAIWRRIVVPQEYTFWDLHVAIQDVMGWLDYHLHRFEGVDIDGEKIEIGIPDPDDVSDFEETEPGWETVLPDVFLDPGDRALYVYDFGDNWLHEVLLEGFFLADEGVVYPLCRDGERACPPEDCGSIPGYYRLLEILKNKNHMEHKEMVRWLKGHEKNYYPYDPERFVPGEIQFSDPQERFDMNFEDIK